VTALGKERRPRWLRGLLLASSRRHRASDGRIPAPTATQEPRYGLIPQSRPPEKKRSRIAAPMIGSGLYPRAGV
jgi:hypothetical protein